MSLNSDRQDALAYTLNMTATQARAVARANRPGRTNVLTTEMIRRAIRTIDEAEENSFSQNVFGLQEWAKALLYSKYAVRKPKNHQYELDFDSKPVRWNHQAFSHTVTIPMEGL